MVNFNEFEPIMQQDDLSATKMDKSLPWIEEKATLFLRVYEKRSKKNQKQSSEQVANRFPLIFVI